MAKNPPFDSGIEALEKAVSEGVSTSLIQGGVLSINVDPTKIDITAGTGRIVDVTDPANIISTLVSWDAKIGVPITNIATQPVTYIAIDIGENVMESATFPSGIPLRTCIHLGSAIHSDLIIIDSVSNFTTARSFQTSVTLTELQTALGVLNTSGNVFSGDPAGNLKLKKTEGQSFFMGYQRDPLDPNTITNAEIVAPMFLSFWRDGLGESVINQVDSIIPGVWDDGVGGVLSPSGILTINRWTNHTVVFLPDAVLVGVIYGQYTYNSLAAAQNAIGQEIIELSPSVAVLPHRATITMRGGAIDLTDPLDAVFRQANKFGEF